MKVQYINSRLFAELLELGGNKLVATYAMLLHGRDGYHYYKPIKNSNNKTTKGKRLISKKSNISLTTLSKEKSHLQALIDLDLCDYTDDGGFFMVGSKKITKLYGRRKKVPIKIGKNLRHTTGNVNAVLIISNIFKQSKQIDKKITLNKALCKERKGLYLSKGELFLLTKARKSEFTDVNNLKKVENIILSNKGLSKLIRGSVTDDYKYSVSHGSYWRKVLQERGFIYSRRRFKSVWNHKISFNEYLSMRSYFYDLHGFVTYKNGRVVKPIVSEVMLTGTDLVDSTIYNTNLINNKYTKSGLRDTSLHS